ncbi:MAG: hypothetical protein DRJ01_15565 [Bacteroidetes bacterium]|nr:MAG: hypothetical protein DRJ01_15565 [Bacteroidota bacterium]
MKKILSTFLLTFFIMLSFNSYSQSHEWTKWKSTDCKYIKYRVKSKDFKNSYGEWRWIVEIKNTSDHTINMSYELKDYNVQNVKSVCCSRDIKPYSTASGIEFWLNSNTQYRFFYEKKGCN